jgi:hypothetical protein
MSKNCPLTQVSIKNELATSLNPATSEPSRLHTCTYSTVEYKFTVEHHCHPLLQQCSLVREHPHPPQPTFYHTNSYSTRIFAGLSLWSSAAFHQRSPRLFLRSSAETVSFLPAAFWPGVCPWTAPSSHYGPSVTERRLLVDSLSDPSFGGSFAVDFGPDARLPHVTLAHSPSHHNIGIPRPQKTTKKDTPRQGIEPWSPALVIPLL